MADAYPFNVKTFGAVGDGIADDTIPIAATETAAESSGMGVVWFPDGKYLTSATTNATSNIVFAGADPATTVVIRKTAYGPMFNFTAPGTNIVDRFGVRGLTLTDAGPSNTTGEFIKADYGVRANFKDLLFFGGTQFINLKGVADTTLDNIRGYALGGASAGRRGIVIDLATRSPTPFWGSNINVNNVSIYGGDNRGATFAYLESGFYVSHVDGLFMKNVYSGGNAVADLRLLPFMAGATCGNIYIDSTSMFDINQGNGIRMDGSQPISAFEFNGKIRLLGLNGAGFDGVLLGGSSTMSDINFNGALVSGAKGNGINAAVAINRLNVKSCSINDNGGRWAVISSGVNNFMLEDNNTVGSMALLNSSTHNQKVLNNL